jgi:uncharacterized protein YneF (UPF0154 family)
MNDKRVAYSCLGWVLFILSCILASRKLEGVYLLTSAISGMFIGFMAEDKWFKEEVHKKPKVAYKSKESRA